MTTDSLVLALPNMSILKYVETFCYSKTSHIWTDELIFDIEIPFLYNSYCIFLRDDV